MPILQRFELTSKVIILTGAAGLFGRQMALALAEAGATLVLASRNRSNLAQLAAERPGLPICCETLDQGKEDSILALRDSVLQKFGRVDGLVNNAVLRPMKSLSDPVSAWEESMRVNATGLFLMTRAFGEVMRRQGGGSIVNIGSMQGSVGPSPELYPPGMGLPPPDYFFHKGGMINMTRYFAGIYGQDNIRVNCVSPGGFFNNQPEPFLNRYKERTMLGRMADDSDLGGAVVFLLSDAARYITAANLPVDGGYTAK